jgi:polygalacturonase
MKLELLWFSARSACIRLLDGGLYLTKEPYGLRLNGCDWGQITTAVHSLFGLQPQTDCLMEVLLGGETLAKLSFTTKRELYTLNVRAFGAKGDGLHDDTPAIQAAIMSCPKESRVLVPKGRYLVSPLFLKSHLRLELENGATLLLRPDIGKNPVLPGMLQSWDEESELNLGTWEGNPLDMHAALLNGFSVEDIELCGEGVLDGQAGLAGWWEEPKTRKGNARRGRMLFLNRCNHVTVQGLTVRNSPSWNLHPYFSNDLRFLNVQVEAPENSPNTDGLNPESCSGVLAAGMRFSVGDDCIAVKSGKLYMGSRYRTPCERIEVMHCLMEKGHGGVTIGSEMAGGVCDVRVHDCLMQNTDRALRVKTRRGRGSQGRIDGIVFERVWMENIATPLVVNIFYFCDPDGHSDYVQSRENPGADHRTPSIGSIIFRDVQAEGCKLAAVILLGLPESKIEKVELINARFSFAEDALPAQPAMADGVPDCVRRGIFALNVRSLKLKDVAFEGVIGDEMELEGVESFIRD